MAVTHVQTAASASITTGDPGSVGQAITWGSGSDRCGFACVTWSDSATCSVAGSVTGAWTAVGSSQATNSDGGRTKNVQWFRKTSPTTGAETVTATFSGTANVCHIAVLEFTGVHQTTPTGTPVTANVASPATTYSHTVTDGATDDYFVTGALAGGVTAVSETDLTSSGDDPAWEAAENSFWNTGCIGGSRAATSSSHQFDYSFTQDEGHCVSGFAVKKAAVASVALTGTAADTIDEDDIVAGGKTIILTLTNETYVPASVDTPIQFVGGATASKVGATSGNSTIALNSGLTGGIASAVAEGDLVVAVFGTGSVANRTLAITDGSSNYTLIGSELYQDDTFDTNLRVAYKFMGSTPDTSTTFGPTGNANDAGAMAVYVFRGVDPSTPLDGVSPVTGQAASTSRVVPPDITPSSAGAYVVVAGAAAHNGGNDTFTSSDLTDFRTQGGNDTNDVTIGIGHQDNWSSGATNYATWGHTQADSTSFSWCGITFALRPAPDTTPFDDARQDLIDGIVAGGSEAHGWDAEVLSQIDVADVVRTSDTVVTITLDAIAAYDIAAQEEVEVTVPASILTGGNPLVATPTFTIDTAGGPVTHATSGALTGAGAVIAGSASSATARPSSGALAAGGATIAGAAARTRVHAASGVLAGAGATVAGAANRVHEHYTSGALAGAGAAVDGAASSTTARPSSGALTPAGAVVAGTAARTRVHSTSGVLAAAGAVVAGTASSATERPSSGALVGGGAVLSGAAERVSGGVVEHATSGALEGGGAVVAGAASSATPRPSSGILVGAGAQIAGTATRFRTHSASGDLIAAGASIAAISARGRDGARIAGGRVRV